MLRGWRMKSTLPIRNAGAIAKRPNARPLLQLKGRLRNDAASMFLTRQTGYLRRRRGTRSPHHKHGRNEASVTQNYAFIRDVCNLNPGTNLNPSLNQMTIVDRASSVCSAAAPEGKPVWDASGSLASAATSRTRKAAQWSGATNHKVLVNSGCDCSARPFKPLACEWNGDYVTNQRLLDECVGLFAIVVNKFRISPFENYALQSHGRNSRWMQFPFMRVNSGLWPGPIVSKRDTLTFYMFERICRSDRHED
jgi:hypothetical protein